MGHARRKLCSGLCAETPCNVGDIKEGDGHQTNCVMLRRALLHDRTVGRRRKAGNRLPQPMAVDTQSTNK